jgi:hypothetical protein
VAQIAFTIGHAMFDESNSFAAIELKQLEMGRLQKHRELDFIQCSRLANSIPDLVFYVEPVPENRGEQQHGMQQRDDFISEFNVDELRDKNGVLHGVGHYVGQQSLESLSVAAHRQHAGNGEPQALTICAVDQLSEKQ